MRVVFASVLVLAPPCEDCRKLVPSENTWREKFAVVMLIEKALHICFAEILLNADGVRQAILNDNVERLLFKFQSTRGVLKLFDLGFIAIFATSLKVGPPMMPLAFASERACSLEGRWQQ